MTPEPLEIVKRARRLRKDMHQEISVVHEDPLAGIVAFDAHGKFTCFLQRLFDFVGNGVRLARVGNRANDKEIRERRDFTKIENFDFGGLLRFRAASRQHPVGKFRWSS